MRRPRRRWSRRAATRRPTSPASGSPAPSPTSTPPPRGSPRPHPRHRPPFGNLGESHLVDRIRSPVIEIEHAFYQEIVEQALREFPNEACGLIAEKEGRPVKVYGMRNADASPVTYRLEPKEQLQVFNDIDEQGWEVWGIYHSHTHSQASPSETDRRQALYPEAQEPI